MDSLKPFNEFIKTQKDLNDLLEGYGIETYKWGKSGTKDSRNLFEEVQKGKCELIVKNGRELLRKVRVVGLNILYSVKTSDNKEISMILREIMRIKKDEKGEYHSKNILKRKHSSSIGKKLTIGEDVISGAKECLKYKLGIIPSNELANLKTYTQEYVSPSYPGLTTIYETNELDLILTQSQFIPEGYCYEREQDLTILEWRIF